VDSPDQGAQGIPASAVTVRDGVLRVEVAMVGGWFEGRLSADGEQAEGEWHQSGAPLPLTLRRAAQLPERQRPQEPKRPYPYEDEEVTYGNTVDGVRLAATLTYPRSGGSFPAVVLITGSGLQDRDETVFGHKPFLVLADHLTRQGIAVLRADDRGVGGSEEGPAGATSEHLAGDALAGVEYLKTREEIDQKRIGLLGHSEGGEIAPMAAVRSPDVAFIVLLAASGVTGREIILEQQALIMKAEGASDQAIANQRAETEAYIEVALEEEDSAVAAERIRELVEASLARMTEEQREGAGVSTETVDAQVKAISEQMLNPWFRFFLTYDPKPALTQVKVPVLAIAGEKDMQVPPKQNLPVIEEALKVGGTQHYMVKELPGLNHLLQTAKTGSPSEYARIEETMSPTALKLIGDWILEHTGPVTCP
jgi:pimeloyl-ACP methyl ester carboxylesterase